MILSNMSVHTVFDYTGFGTELAIKVNIIIMYSHNMRF